MPNISYDAVLAVDALTLVQSDSYNAFEKLREYQTLTKDWIFGYLSYDLKNDVEDLVSNNFDGLKFPELFFFQPKKLFFLKGETMEAHYLNMVEDEWEDDLQQIQNLKNTPKSRLVVEPPIKIKSRISPSDYISKVGKLLDHIHRGDIYEANFCQEFYAENSQINPLDVYFRLNTISKPPFASFFKNDNFFALSASPERYLKKMGLKVISQPIKGTARRSENKTEDNDLVKNLRNDPKERSENIMIVDLVRNDLSKTAVKGSVTVEELCKIYSFEQVHQMISTVSSIVKPNTHPVDVLQSTFPMGSMTGAPKISAMKLIEELEKTKRGLYSGSIGYFSPSGDFDFNVVIRSILYNTLKRYLSFSVGSAITSKSLPDKEFEECIIKSEAMHEVLK